MATSTHDGDMVIGDIIISPSPLWAKMETVQEGLITLKG